MQSSKDSQECRRINPYHALGCMHGTAVLIDDSKPDEQVFLDHMERRLPDDQWEEYFDGFAEGKLGLHKRTYKQLRCFMKHGSDEQGWPDGNGLAKKGGEG